jgi:hypothetical protein
VSEITRKDTIVAGNTEAAPDSPEMSWPSIISNVTNEIPPSAVKMPTPIFRMSQAQYTQPSNLTLCNRAFLVFQRFSTHF